VEALDEVGAEIRRSNARTCAHLVIRGAAITRAATSVMRAAISGERTSRT